MIFDRYLARPLGCWGAVKVHPQQAHFKYKPAAVEVAATHDASRIFSCPGADPGFSKGKGGVLNLHSGGG